MNDIKKLRKLVGIRQFDMAEKLGMEQGNYCNLENGRYIPLNLDKIHFKCLEVLLPELDNLIFSKRKELFDLIEYRKTFLVNHKL